MEDLASIVVLISRVIGFRRVGKEETMKKKKHEEKLDAG